MPAGQFKSNLSPIIISVVAVILTFSFIFYAWKTVRIDDQTVAVVTQEIARLENAPAGSPPLIQAFDYRPGFKGKYLRAAYTLSHKNPEKTKERYFLIRKPFFGPWQVTYEINEETYNKEFPGSAPPTKHF